ncbi:MAG: DNA polymerase III subunit beta [Erysipelotrichaceae bacterium]|nr:DNA polymerase III subunit beta [Erysipelotrichaceae bacterium]
MNFKISKKSFLDSLTLVFRAVSSNTPLPSLGGIKIEVEENKITLIASDSNISIKSVIEGNNEEALIINETGEIVIDGKYLMDIVRKIDGNLVSFETIDGLLVKFSGEKSQFKINGMNAAEYPVISFEINDNKPFEIDSKTFMEIIDQTAFACSDKETRPVLTGVNLKVENGVLHANATDSYRLAYKKVKVDSDIGINITVPAKYLNEIYHSIGNNSELKIAIDNQKISFIIGNSVIQTRLLDDVFPDTSRLVPATFSSKLLVSSKEISNAIDRTSFIKSDGKNTVRMNISNEAVEITSSNQIGSSFEKIPVVSYEGNPLEISCSGKYLQDAIRSLSCETVEFDFSGELKPMILKSTDDESLIQLISPVRTYR